jgi:hypothetical protein
MALMVTPIGIGSADAWCSGSALHALSVRPAKVATSATLNDAAIMKRPSDW